MNIFRAVSCINLKDEDMDNLRPGMQKPSYNGPIVILENIQWSSLFLFFPISKKNMDIITSAMGGNTDAKALSIYKTMIDSWKGSGNFLSGIIMDLNYEQNSTEPKILVNFALASSEDGKLNSLVPVNFVDAVIISVLLQQDFMVGTRLLNLMLPENQPDEPINDTSHPFQDDQDIKDIVRNILDGKVQDSFDGENDEENEDLNS